MNLDKVETKQVYQQQIEANLQAFQVLIDRLKAEAATAQADAKVYSYGKLAALNAKQQETQRKLHELKAASGDAWRELRIGTETALLELQDAFNSALAQFKHS
ncbi:MAG TPA: hypothetical protein V6C65_00505 [Allocoleopsis sp.]